MQNSREWESDQAFMLMIKLGQPAMFAQFYIVVFQIIQ